MQAAVKTEELFRHGLGRKKKVATQGESPTKFSKLFKINLLMVRN